MYLKKAFKKIIPFLLVFCFLIGNAYCFIARTDSQTDVLGVNASISSGRAVISPTDANAAMHMFTFTEENVANADFNTSIQKQCRIKNTSSFPVRAFLLIKMPNFDAPYNENGSVVDNGAVPFANLFHSGKTNAYVLLRTDSTDPDYTIYLFGYSLGNKETVAANGTTTMFGSRLFDIRDFTQTPAVNFSHEYAADMVKRTSIVSYVIPADAAASNAAAVSILPDVFVGDTDLYNVCTRGV